MVSSLLESTFDFGVSGLYRIENVRTFIYAEFVDV